MTAKAWRTKKTALMAMSPPGGGEEIIVDFLLPLSQFHYNRGM